MTRVSLARMVLVAGVATLAFVVLRLRPRGAVDQGETGTEPEVTRVRRLYDKMAPGYDAGMRLFEKLLFGGGRRWVAERTRGRVLDVGIGTGRNLPAYPAGIALVGLDLSPAMLQIARERAEQLGRPAHLVVGDAAALPFPDEGFDTVVFTLALCTIPDDAGAIAEARRVLRPNGRLVLLEHVASPRRAVRAIQDLLDPLAVRAEGDHLTREPLDLLAARSFAIDDLERRKLGVVERVLAHKPAEASRQS